MNSIEAQVTGDGGSVPMAREGERGRQGGLPRREAAAYLSAHEKNE